MIKWLLKRKSEREKKQLVLFLIEQLDHDIDNITAEKLLTAIVKASGNKVTSFIVKD